MSTWKRILKGEISVRGPVGTEVSDDSGTLVDVRLKNWRALNELTDTCYNEVFYGARREKRCSKANSDNH